MLRSYRKPLVLATPKIGLKHPNAVSSMQDFAPGKKFQPILVDNFNEGESELVILCSGKVYYDISPLLKESSRAVKLIRVEELAPFPSHLIEAELSAVSKDANVVWLQEESLNQGAF